MKALVRPRAIGGSKLVRDYLDSIPEAASFYGGAPFSLDSYRTKLSEVTRRFDRPMRERAALALTPTSERARDRLDRFVEAGGAMVTTGQQAGFLTGPLYTIYKALSAVALASRLERELGILVLPVFWVASEDHDWDEVNHTFLTDPRGRLHRFELPSEDVRPLQMSDRRLEGEIEILLDEIQQVVGVKENNRIDVNRILDPYRVPGSTVGEAFGVAITRLFADVDLLVADAAHPSLKAASSAVLRTALVEAKGHEQRLDARAKAIEEAGYAVQVNVLERGTNVFLRTEQGRERLFTRGNDFAIREKAEAFDGAGLLERLDRSPEDFSPNVFLRPVVESAVFPTLAYVGGPGELAYFAQVTALFEAYDILPPVVVPRFAAMVMEPQVERVMKSLGVSEADLREPKEVLVDRIALRELPRDLRDSLDSLRERLAEEYERLIDAAIELDPTLGNAVGNIRNRSLFEAKRAERKVVRALKRGDNLSLDQLDRILNAVYPNGGPQDRTLNILPYLSRYGAHFIREVEQSIQDHWRFPIQR